MLQRSEAMEVNVKKGEHVANMSGRHSAGMTTRRTSGGTHHMWKSKQPNVLEVPGADGCRDSLTGSTVSHLCAKLG